MHLRVGQSGRGGKPLTSRLLKRTDERKDLNLSSFLLFLILCWSDEVSSGAIICLLQLCVVQCTPEDLRPPEQVVSILDFSINVTVASNTEFQLIFQLNRQPWFFCCQCSGSVFMFRVHLKSKLYNICDVSKGGTCVFAYSPGSCFIHISSLNSKACCANMAEWCSRAVSVCL